MTGYLRLRDLREDHELTQQQVARMLNTTPQYYQKYEKGVRPITAERLIILAKFYQVSVDYLLGLTDEPRPYPRAK